MKPNGFKMLYRHIALLLCAVLVFTSPGTNVFAEELSGGSTTVNTEGDAGKYTVNVSRAGEWLSVGAVAPFSSTTSKIEIDGIGLVEKKAGGGYHVRLGYAGYSLFDAIQVVDPKQNEAVRAYIHDVLGNGFVSSFPRGTFDLPKNAESCINPEYYSKLTPADITPAKPGERSPRPPYVTEAVNRFYLSKDEVNLTRLDPKMDWGGIEFDIDSLSDYVIINPLTTANPSLGPAIVGFDQSSLAPVPDSFTYKPGTYHMGYQWTNTVPWRAAYSAFAAGGMAGMARRGDEFGKDGGIVDITGISALNNLFEKEVEVTAAEDGTMSAVLKVNMDSLKDIYLGESTAPDPIVSIEIAEERNTSFKWMTEQKIRLADMFSEMFGDTWTEIPLNETVEIPFHDLMDGKLIRIITQSQKDKNDAAKSERTKRYFWGRLWLKEAVGEKVQKVAVKASNGAVLKTDTATFKPGDKFICQNESALADEDTIDGVKAFSKDDDSYKVYSYWIENKEGEAKIPVSPVTIDLPAPKDMDPNRIMVLSNARGNGSRGGAYDLPPGSRFVKNETGAWVLRITPSDLSRYEYNIIISDTGKRMSWNDMQSTFEKGKYYEVRGVLANVSYDNRPSMAANLFYEHKVFLHVTEDGKYELYAKLKGIKVGQYGYAAKMFYQDNDGLEHPVDIMGYKSTASLSDDEWAGRTENNPDLKAERSEDDLTIDSFAKQLSCHYPDVIKLPLNEPSGETRWRLNVVVPLMNMVLSKDPAGYLRNEKELNLYLISGSEKEVEPSVVYPYDKSLLLGTIEDAEKDHDNLPEGEQKSSLKAAIDKATATYQELKTSFDTNTLLNAVSELEAAIPKGGVQALATGIWSVPIAMITDVNGANGGTISRYAKYFGDAIVTVDDTMMTVKLDTKTVDGSVVTGFRYTSETGGFQDASPIPGSSGNVTGYSFTRPYTEDSILIEFTLSSVPYPLRAWMSMDVKNAVGITAADEALIKLKALAAEANAILAKEDSTALYTPSSLETLSAEVKKAQTVIDSGAQAQEADIETQITNLTAAKEGLILKPAVDNPMEALKELLESFKNHDAAAYEATAEEAFEASWKAAQALLDPDRKYEVSDEQMAAQLDATKKEQAALIDSEVINRMIGANMRAFFPAPYEPETGGGRGILSDRISEKIPAETADLPIPESMTDPGKKASAAEVDQTLTEGADKNSTEGTDQTLTEGADKNSTEGTDQTLTEGTDKISTEGTEETTAEGTKTISAKQAADSGKEGKMEVYSVRPTLTRSLNGSFRIMSIASSSDAATRIAGTDGNKAAADVSSGAAAKTDGETTADKTNGMAETEAATSKAAGETTTGTDKTADGTNTTPTAAAPIAKPQAAPRTAEAVTRAMNRAAAGGTGSLNKVSMDNGIYAIDYHLQQFGSLKNSMGDPALVDAYPELPGKQAKLEIKNGKAYLYLGFQKMEFANLTGHLLSMVIMDNLETNDEDVIQKFTPVKPVAVETTDETDKWGPPSGQKYPKLLKFDVTKYIAGYKDNIPVQVNVPVMQASATQPAYIHLDYGTMQQVEGSEKPDTQAPQSTADFTQLKEAVAVASKIRGSAADGTYTKESYTALLRSISAAEELENYAGFGIGQEYVDKRTAAVTATAKALIPLKDMSSETITPSGDGVNPGTDNTDRGALGRILTKIAGYKQSDYTPDSYAAMMTAYKAAYSVYDNQDATALELTLAKSRLQNAIDGLKTFTVKKTKLMAAINTAGTLQESSFTPESWLRFTFALSEAKAVADDASATQDEVDRVWIRLSQSIDQLAGKTASTVGLTTARNESVSERGKKDKKDGYYKVSVRLWHSNMDKASMGDAAIAKTAYVHIDGGESTMRMVSREMTVSGITAHLHDFWIYRDGDYQEAELVSSDNDKWVYEFDLPNSHSAYYKCKVDPKVDVMGDDPVKARLKVSWGSLKKVSRSDWDDMSDDDSGSRSGSTFTSSRPKQVELTSSETGIKVSGNPAGPGMALEASKMESGDRYDRAVSVLGDKVKRFVLYDISLRSGEKYVEPSGSVTIQIPVPNEYDSRNLSLYRVNDDGSLQEIYGRVNGGYFEATVDHFSLYALGESSQPQDGTAQNNTQGSQDNTAAQNTGSGIARSTGGSRSTTRSAGPKASAALASNQEFTGNTAPEEAEWTQEERTIPYTGDPMPVKSVMGIGILALLISLGTMIPEKGSKRNRWKKGQNG